MNQQDLEKLAHEVRKAAGILNARMEEAAIAGLIVRAQIDDAIRPRGVLSNDKILDYPCVQLNIFKSF